MERTLSVKYPVLRQNKHVILNMFEKHHSRKIQHCTYTLYIVRMGSKKG